MAGTDGHEPQEWRRLLRGKPQLKKRRFHGAYLYAATSLIR